MQYLFVLTIVLLILIVAIVVVTSCFLPQKEEVQFEIKLLTDSDCSFEKVVLDLKTVNDLEDIESSVQQKLLC